MAILILAALLLAAAGCDFLRDPEPLGLPGGGATVHSILVAGSDTAAVYLTRVDPDDFQGLGPGAQPLTGADVRIVDGADTVRLPEAPPGFPRCYAEFPSADETESAGPGCYAGVLPGRVRSGAEYGLLISLKDGTAIRGEAVVPPPPAIVAPQSGARFYFVPGQGPDPFNFEVPVRWDAPPATAGVEPTLGPTAVFRDGAVVPKGRCEFGRDWWDVPVYSARDSAWVDVSYISCREPSDSAQWVPLEWDSIQARVRVLAYDSAYARYRAILGDGSARPEEAALGISGALGVFGGAAGADRPVMIVAPSAEP